MRTEAVTEQRVEAVRRFNRFYTKKIGILREGLLNTRFSLAQARVLFELAHAEAATATALAGELGLDPGYLSRILERFQKGGDARGVVTGPRPLRGAVVVRREQ